MTTNLSQIKKVKLRNIWENEAYDFTEWLMKEENISLLSEEIGVEINSVQSEADVGSFSVDILAEEEGGNRSIVIENQLEITDHDHLGKLLTYAAGYSADIIIWIFKDIREEHRQAIDWLNQNSNEDLAFFGVQIELWQIGDSNPAPKFNIVSKPNEWAKILKQRKDSKELTDTKVKQMEFWAKFKEYGEDKINLSFRTPRPQHWYDFSIGISNAHISASMNTRDNNLSCVLYISDNKELFNYLIQNKEELEQKLGGSLEFSEGEKDGRVILSRDGFDLDDEDKYKDRFDWLIGNMRMFRDVFGECIEGFNVTELNENQTSKNQN